MGFVCVGSTFLRYGLHLCGFKIESHHHFVVWYPETEGQYVTITYMHPQNLVPDDSEPI